MDNQRKQKRNRTVLIPTEFYSALCLGLLLTGASRFGGTALASPSEEPHDSVNLVVDDKVTPYLKFFLDQSDRCIKDFIEKEGIVGGSMVVVCGGKTIGTSSYGVDSLSGQRRFSEQTKCRMGSESKTLTALAALSLCNKGQLSLSTKVVEFLGLRPYVISPLGIDSRIYNISVEDLIYQTSGIDTASIDQRLIVTQAGIKKSPPLACEDVLRYYLGKGLLSAPGTRQIYNNKAYDLLGLVISRASEKSYEECVKAEVLNNLGMSSTFIGRGGRNAEKLLNESDYFELGSANPAEDRVTLYGMEPSGGWVTTAQDLGRLMNFLGGHSNMKVNVKPEQLYRIVQAVLDSRNQNHVNNYYGGGVFVELFRSQKGEVDDIKLSHGGIHMNAYSYYQVNLKNGFGFAFLLNSYRPGADYTKELIIPLQQIAE